MQRLSVVREVRSWYMSRRSADLGTILVVEDYEDARGMLRILLESDCFRVFEAADGAKALEVLRSEQPDIILMDLAMPGLDGFETIRRIRDIDKFQDTPIIVLTAYGQMFSEEILRAGANHVIDKPIDVHALENLLRNLIRSASESLTSNVLPPMQ